MAATYLEQTLSLCIAAPALWASEEQAEIRKTELNYYNMPFIDDSHMQGLGLPGHAGALGCIAAARTSFLLHQI